MRRVTQSNRTIANKNGISFCDLGRFDLLIFNFEMSYDKSFRCAHWADYRMFVIKWSHFSNGIHCTHNHNTTDLWCDWMCKITNNFRQNPTNHGTDTLATIHNEWNRMKNASKRQQSGWEFIMGEELSRATRQDSCHKRKRRRRKKTIKFDAT